MQARDLPPDVIAALATLLRYAKSMIRDAMVDSQPEESGEGAYYDARSAPMGPTAFLRLAREGAFPATKVGRKVLARKSDVNAWIRSRTENAPHRSTREAEETRETPIALDGDLDAFTLHELMRDASFQGRQTRPLRQAKRGKGR